MQRILEPELMTDVTQCQAYAAANFAASNQAFVDIVSSLLPPEAKSVLDLGCGPADVMIRLAQARPMLNITAVDGSSRMIRLARQAILAGGFADRIRALEGFVPGLALADGEFDAVLSKDFLHHLPNPMLMWQEIRRLVRLGGLICVMDLRRPDSPEAAQAIVDAVAKDEPEILRIDFLNSLCAAFTLNEIRDQLKLAALDLLVSEFGDRHLLIHSGANSDS